MYFNPVRLIVIIDLRSVDDAHDILENLHCFAFKNINIRINAITDPFGAKHHLIWKQSSLFPSN